MCPMNGRDEVQTLESHGITWSWHDSCGNCGCVANWHAFDIPAGATMVALPERFPCKGFEFQGCPHGCTNYVFQPATAAISATHRSGESALDYWNRLKAAAGARRAGRGEGGD